jgi:hypothetical protein
MPWAVLHVLSETKARVSPRATVRRQVVAKECFFLMRVKIFLTLAAPIPLIGRSRLRESLIVDPLTSVPECGGWGSNTTAAVK